MTKKVLSRRTVWVACYEHRHGSDIRVFASAAGAEQWRRDIADEWWDHEMKGSRPSDPDKRADAYFDTMGEREEFFNCNEHVVEA